MKKTIISSLVATMLSSVLVTPAFAHKAGDFIFRAGVAFVEPDESSDDVLGALGLGSGEFKVDDDTQLGLNFGYMITDNIGVELLAASPFTHDVSLPGLGEIGDTKQLPPTLVVQYYFGDSTSSFRPYVGAGVNYTQFFDSDFNSSAKELGLDNLSLDSSVGFAAQVGLDYQINDNWLVNGSIWYLQINTDVNFTAGDTAFSVDTDIDPWVYMVSVGYTF